MDSEELAWAAGFFDGEGCFSYTSAGQYASASIGQSERWPLERFQRALRVGTIDGPYARSDRRGRWNKKRQFCFRVYRQADLVHLGSALWPLLGSMKRAQFLRTLELARLPVPKITLIASGRASGASLRSRRDLAWAAGFLDADGCFSFTEGARVGCVSITQTETEVLERFQEAVGVGKIYGPYLPRQTDGWTRKPYYLYRVHRFEDVQAIAAMLWAFLGPTKRAQAATVLRRLPKRCRRGHVRPPGAGGCPRCTADYWRAYREERGRPASSIA